jgi:hypothetical protein
LPDKKLLPGGGKAGRALSHGVCNVAQKRGNLTRLPSSLDKKLGQRGKHSDNNSRCFPIVAHRDKSAHHRTAVYKSTGLLV